MTEQNTEVKLKNLLKQEKIQLWNPPYTEDDNQPGLQHLQELAERYAPLLRLPVLVVGGALESIRAQAVKRGKGNKTFRETSVATLELLLPKENKKDKKSYLQTRLDVPLQQVSDRILEDFGLKHIKLILNGRTLRLDQHLDEQGVKNHSKVMVLKVSDAEQLNKEEEEKKNQSESLQRTQKGFQILSERDGSEDPETTPFLEIADQKGNPLKIPQKEKKALILAMGFHEKGRSLMKRRLYDSALCHLLQADQNFRYRPDPVLFWRLNREDMAQLMSLGFSEREARLGLRACHGDLQQAEAHISNRRQERQELVQKERQKRRTRTEAITTLTELGFSRRDATRALHHAEGDMDKAYTILLDSFQTRTLPEGTVSPEKVEQLLYLGFERDSAEAALRLTGGDVQSATQLLLHNQGVLSPDLLSPPSASPTSEDTSTSSAEDNELVNEVLEDIPRHEEDYLDLTLEEESELITALKTYLS
uniref:Negative regulator of ubiquitin-like proteins 1 n=1 Tax=Iconisemion striatum TaxID=60296 RepID=A0A1A7W9Q2_9TELE